MSRITVSPKHGVNPSLSQCYYCLKDKNEIILPGRIRSKDGINTDVEAPHRAVWNKEPCDECKKWMEAGVICISVRDGETDMENPYRTGHWSVVKAEVFERMRGFITTSVLDGILAKRVVFLEDMVWKQLGFPTEEVKPSP